MKQTVVQPEDRILVVDDNAAGRYVMGHALERAGFSVIEAGTGEAALRLVATDGPDAVILDVNLPDLHGYEVRARIKGDALTRHIPVVHVSASSVSAGDRVTGLEGGADAYLIQPIEPEELVATVRALLRLGRSEEQVRIAAQHWALTFDNAVVGMVTHDLDGRIVQANPAFCRMVGRDAESLHHLLSLELIHPDDREERARNLRQAVAGSAWARYTDDRYRHARGRDIWAQTSSILVRDAAGRPLYFLSQVVDMTEPRSTAEFLKAVLHNISDAVVACDVEGQLVFSNPAASGLLPGVPVESLTPAGWTEQPALHLPESTRPLGREQLPLQRALEGDELRDLELAAVLRDGERRILLNNGQAIVDARGNRFGAVVVMRDATVSKRAEAALAHQALHDPLTGLPNRALLLDRIGQALSRRQPSGSVAALFLDLDRFKVVNDSLGHEVGDELIVSIAHRLRSVVRPSDTVARLGGDEFVVLCEGVGDPQDVIALSERIEAAVATPVNVGARGVDVVVAVSVGVVIADDNHVRPDDLLRDADTAMYRAKQRGGSRHEVFDDSFRVEAVGRLQVENELRHAIEDDRVRVHYQPIVDLTTGRISGVEALVRYEDPAGGLVQPVEFLTVAEESGLIVPLGARVLDEACRQAVRWRREGGYLLQMSVNLSARQLTRPGFVDVVEKTLLEHGLEPGTLSLEITESALMDAALSNPNLLEGLKAAGPRLGIDDFGTGYSSLTYLRRFPVDFIKIDRTFVDGLGKDAGDTAIVKAVIGLGTALGLMTIAEGVETSQHLSVLRELGCDLAQGFHFARPLPADALTELLASQPRW
ncbi:MAG: EAL domain-containing protein [Acidimicrobiales bacterium]